METRIRELEARIAELEAADRDLRSRLGKITVSLHDLRDAIREQNLSIAKLSDTLDRLNAKGSSGPVLSFGPPAVAVRTVRNWLAFGIVAVACGIVLGLGECVGTLDMGSFQTQGR